MNKLAIIRMSGQIHLQADVEKTFRLLNLDKKFACTILEETPEVKGMLQVVKDKATWGIVDDATFEKLSQKIKKESKVVHLHPPIGGFERKGTKKAFTVGGALGNRKEKINDLLAKMM